MTASHGYRRYLDCKYRTDAAMKMEFDSQMLRLVWHQETGRGTIATNK